MKLVCWSFLLSSCFYTFQHTWMLDFIRFHQISSCYELWVHSPSHTYPFLWLHVGARNSWESVHSIPEKSFMNAWFHHDMGCECTHPPWFSPSCAGMWVQAIPEKECTHFLRNHSWMLDCIMLWAVGGKCCSLYFTAAHPFCLHTEG